MREIGDRRNEANFIEPSRNNCREKRDFVEAERLYSESLAIKREIGDRQGEAELTG